jgi:hypothetical protein
MLRTHLRGCGTQARGDNEIIYFDSEHSLAGAPIVLGNEQKCCRASYISYDGQSLKVSEV